MRATVLQMGKWSNREVNLCFLNGDMTLHCGGLVRDGTEMLPAGVAILVQGCNWFQTDCFAQVIRLSTQLFGILRL